MSEAGYLVVAIFDQGEEEQAGRRTPCATIEGTQRNESDPIDKCFLDWVSAAGFDWCCVLTDGKSAASEISHEGKRGWTISLLIIGEHDVHRFA